MTATTAPTNNLYSQFAEALALTGGTSHRAVDVASASEIIESIVRTQSSDTTAATVWSAPLLRQETPELLQMLGDAGIRVKSPATPEDVRDQPFGLSLATQAIAETGSVLLVERELPDRSVGLMTECHIVICRLDDIAPSLEDAATTLASIGAEHGSYATLVTGPSRTADIERQLTVGVQGPAKLHVIFVDLAS